MHVETAILKQGRVRSARVPLIVMAMLALAASGWAQDAGSKVVLHGFGGWAYAQTDENNCQIGTEKGTYDNVSFALNVNAKVSDKLTVVGQFEFQQRPGYADMDRTLDFAFAEWAVNDGLKLRAGRVKHPFGIYGEIFNVGTLRPFYMLPQSIYGPERYTARSVDGLGITGMKTWDSGWGINYDVYAGRISGELRLAGRGAPGEELHLGSVSYPFGFDEVLGGRLVVVTPVDGLSFGSSAYRGDTDFSTEGEGQRHDEEALGFQVEYQAEPILLRAEYGTIFNVPSITFNTYYVEGAVKVYKGLQLAARYDGWKGDIDLPNAPTLTHRDIVLGVNYWFSPNFVVKADYHIAEGNRYTHPDEPTGTRIVAELADTKMFVFGTHFSF